MAYRAPRHTAEQWAELVAQFDQSSESIQAFCTRHKLGFSTFHKWRRRFGTDSQPIAATDAGRSGFVEAVQSNDKTCSVILHIGQDMRLLIPIELGVDTIADLTRTVINRVGG